MGTQRLFFALWPDDAVRARIEALARRLPARLGRRVPPENFHITLEFIGNVGAAARQCLETAASELKAEPFEFNLERFGYFPGSRVVWLAPGQLPAPMLKLACQLRAAGQRCGYQPEERPYHPHITLFRKVARPPRWPIVEPVVWKVTDFALVESITTEKGATYHLIRRWDLSLV
jgi:2'-5' RNA ligase